MGKLAARTVRVALSVAGSAILLCSCERGGRGDSSTNEETLMTEYSEDLSVVMSQNGRRSYHFVTPLLEGYSLSREPYREFRKGVKITTYKDDSLSTVDVVLTANYAIYYENRELWEAKGNVVAEKSDGKTLYTQQLFWNAKTKKIYSNVDSKIVQNDGRDVFIGEGFESDEEFKDWRFRRMKGRMEVDAAAMQRRDSLAADSTATSSAGGSRSVPDADSQRERPSAGHAPTAKQPAVEQPAAKPAAQQPAGELPARELPGAKPAGELPAVEEPALKEPAAERPAAKQAVPAPQSLPARPQSASVKPSSAAK